MTRELETDEFVVVALEAGEDAVSLHRINRCGTTVLPLMGVPLPFPEGRRVVMMDD